MLVRSINPNKPPITPPTIALVYMEGIYPTASVEESWLGLVIGLLTFGVAEGSMNVTVTHTGRPDGKFPLADEGE